MRTENLSGYMFNIIIRTSAYFTDSFSMSADTFYRFTAFMSA